jgi:heme exporter protein D
VWMAIGLALYAVYGYRHSVLRQRQSTLDQLASQMTRI